MKLVEQNAKGVFYRIKKTDDLKKISLQFLVPESLLIFENDLSNEVFCGQILYIPHYNYKLYIVKPLESVESVCKKFNLKKEDFIKKNKTDIVFDGQLVYI